MDGLMLDTERMARAAWMRALSEHNMEIETAAYLRLIGRTAQDTQSILTELFGPTLPYNTLRIRIQHHYDADIEQNGIPTKAGLFELLDFLDACAIPKAVATSALTEFATRKLRIAGIEGRFSTVVCGDMVPRGKPEPDLFLEAARRIAVPPRRCVVLEDSEPGILAAQAAGMLPVMVPDLKPPEPEIRAICYRVLPSLSSAIPVLAGFLRDGLPW
jgi:beta-phosphoglucomutase-like phosphatase (HAD superfamily)